MKPTVIFSARSIITIILFVLHSKHRSFSPAFRNLVEEGLTGKSRASISVAKSTDNSSIGIVYLDYIPGSNPGEGKTLYFAMLDSSGVQLSDYVLRASDGTWIYDPFILGISESKFVACFTATSSLEIHAAIFDRNGNIIKSDFQVSAATGAVGCSIAYLATGSFVIFWTDNYHIRFQIFDNFGTPQGTEYAKNYPELIEKGCSCEAFSNDEFFCAFSKMNASTYDVYGQKFSYTGNKVGSSFLINDDSSYNQHSPKVKIIDSSSVIVCYIVDGVSPSQLMCRNFDNSQGATPTASEASYIVTSSPMPAGFQPSEKPIELVASNRIQIAVSDTNGNIYSYRIKTDGKVVGNKVKINTSSIGCSTVNIIYLSGQLLYFWAGRTDTSTDSDIILKKVSNVLTCSNYQVSVDQSQEVDLDFTSYITDPINLSITVYIISLPTAGTIQKISDGSAIELNMPYGLTELKYIAGSSSTTESISYKGVNSASDASPLCTIDVDVSISIPVISSCYITCGTCASLGDATDNKCTTCIAGSTHVLYGQTSQCLETAPEYYYLNSSEDMYKPCYSTCATCNADPIPSSQGCITCRSNFIKHPNDSTSCVKQCNLGGAEKWYIDEVNNSYICSSQCPISRPFYIESTSECVNECRGNLLYNNKCVASCPQGTMEYLNTICYETCPQYTVTDNINSKCTNCKSTGQFFYQGQCYDTPPINSQLVNSEYNAYVSRKDLILSVACPASAPYTLNGACLESCPAKMVTDTGSMTCVNCKDSGTYMMNNMCVQTCPIGYGADDENLCQLCEDTGISKYSYNGKCVDTCPEGYAKDYETLSCKSCKSLGISSNVTCSQYAETIDCIQNVANLQLNETTKNDVKSYIAELIKMNQTYSQTIQTGLLSIQISNSTEVAQEQTLQDALKYHLSIVDFSSCERQLRMYYNISNDQELAYSKIDFKTQNSSVTTSSISYEVYGPTGVKLNTSVCSSTGTEVLVSIPLTANNSVINITAYSSLSDVVDIYNSSADFYNSRCVSYSTEDVDIPVNERRSQMYSGYNAVCSAGCTYDGLNVTTNYAKCSCTDISGEMSINFIENLLDLFSTINLDIVTCYMKTFEMPQFYSNYGFFTFICAGVAAAVISSLSLLTDQRLFSKGLASVYNNDSGILDELNQAGIPNNVPQGSGNTFMGPPACPPRNFGDMEPNLNPNPDTQGSKRMLALDSRPNTDRNRKYEDKDVIVKIPSCPIQKQRNDQEDMAYLKKLGFNVKLEHCDASPSASGHPSK